MYGDPVFYNWMTFTEALGLDKSFECITAPLHGVRGTQRKFSPKFIETRFRLSSVLLDLQKYILRSAINLYLFGHPRATWVFSKLKGLQQKFPENFRFSFSTKTSHEITQRGEWIAKN